MLAVALVLAIIAALWATNAQQNANVAQGPAEANAAFAQTREAEANDARSTAQASENDALLAADARATALVEAEESAAIAQTHETEASEAKATAEANEAIAEAQRIAAERQSRISLAQLLAALAPTLLQPRANDTELANLLALEALRLNTEEAGGVTWLVDSSLRSLLSEPYFSSTINGHESIVWSVAFSPDGRWLASGSADGTVWLELILDVLAEIGCQKVRRNLTQAEWTRYLGDEPYHITGPDLPPGA